jgi:hypothetical protein
MCNEERPDRTEPKPNAKRRRIVKALGACGVIAVVAAVAAVVTQAVTHNTAVRENCFAYVNGLNDGYGLAIERLSELLTAE